MMDCYIPYMINAIEKGGKLKDGGIDFPDSVSI